MLQVIVSKNWFTTKEQLVLQAAGHHLMKSHLPRETTYTYIKDAVRLRGTEDSVCHNHYQITTSLTN